MSILIKLHKELQGKLPEYVINNSVYETIMGSNAYGTALENKSDLDIYVIYLPKREQLFPNLAGKIWGFDQFDEHKTYNLTKIKKDENEFDIQLYSITTFFKLASECNPNIIDSLFVDYDCIRKLSNVGHLIRDNRKLFLSKLVYAKFRGYAYSQLSKVRIIVENANTDILSFYKQSKKENFTSKRFEINETGIDWKFLYHVFRLVYECEQILSNGDLNLRQDNEFYKQIRKGNFSLNCLLEIFCEKEKYLEKLYNESKLTNVCDKKKIKELLINCLEIHYGNLSEVLYISKYSTDNFIIEMKQLMEKYNL